MADISDNSNFQADTNIAESLLTDISTLRTAFNTLVTKLNADAGVTDTNYAQAGALTTTV